MKTFSRNKIWIAIAAAAVLLVFIFAFIITEALFTAKIRVKNHSAYDIEKMYFYFEGEELQQTDWQELPLIAKDEEYETELAEFDFSEMDGASSLTLAITFAGQDTFYLQSGSFYEKFDGIIDCKLSMDDDGDVILKLKASNGLLGSTAQTDCNDMFFINLTEGYVQ